MSTDLLHALLEQIDWHWTTHLRPRLDGLTDDEYFWEPAPGCWTIRRRGERFIGDWQWPPPDPAPFTTIAWRLVHMAGPCLDWRKRELIDGETVDVENYPYPGTADDALALLDQGYGAWMDAMRALGDRVLEPMGPRAGSTPTIRGWE